MKMFGYAPVAAALILAFVAALAHADGPGEGYPNPNQQPMPGPVDQFPQEPCGVQCAQPISTVCVIQAVGPNAAVIFLNGQPQYGPASMPEVQSAIAYYLQIGLCQAVAQPRPHIQPYQPRPYAQPYQHGAGAGYAPPLAAPRY